MKLEMRVWDLDVKVELHDEDAEDQLRVLTMVRDLLDVLGDYEKVDISIKQIESDPVDPITVEETHVDQNDSEYRFAN